MLGKEEKCQTSLCGYPGQRARGGCTQCADDQDQEQSKDVESEIVRVAILVGATGWSVVDIVASIASVKFGEEEGCWNL